ncbi:extracellular solute-binding protein [Candidatus Falkowbacteria bacterium]|jgi:multiple sugar transport system substrate-binding protein|nr:extracellular solute-binding protein [Candidatus Falkowbacteria bacterium]
MSKKIAILALLMVFILNSGFGCKTTKRELEETLKPITLTYWRVFDDSDAFDEIITKYKALHPNININYKKLRLEEYETELLNALAEDRGPDIFSIHNTWIKKYQPKLLPLPESTTLVYPVVTGTIKKETTYQNKTTKSITNKEVRDKFVDVVGRDVILNDEKIYGLPLSVDTLAMYYNKDLFNNAGISKIPNYWNREFLQTVNKLTKHGDKNALIQSGAALGGSTNINRYSDILAILMMQSGTTMIDDTGKVLFNASAGYSTYNPAADALRFYIDFADQTKESYSWNSDLPNSLEMFISGNLGIMFAYSYDLPTIKAQAPKLNFSIAPLPQIEGNPPTNINMANYWVEVVSKKTPHADAAWDFVQFITKEEQAKTYLEKTHRPTALRSLIDLQKNDEEINVFVNQVLTAKSWYRGKNVKAAEDAIAEMINNALIIPSDKLQTVLNTAATKIQQTIY